MKVKEINGELVAVMSIKEAVFLGTILAHMSGSGINQVTTIGSPLWDQYGYVVGFLDGASYPQFTPKQSKLLQEHVDGILEEEV